METNWRDRARLHRSRLREVAFIGITGSCGKTTAKDLAAGLLQPDLRGLSSPDDGNCGAKLVDHILRVQPSHDFCIQELGAWGPGTLDAGLELVRPDIGVVLNVRSDHLSRFRSLDHTQAEKSKVVSCLPATGVAILNADDARVWEMRRATSAAVLGFGSNPDADLQVDRVRSPWPERLSFGLRFGEDTYRVTTQLIGAHLVGSALAALGVAVAMGVPLATAIDRLALLPPTARRMSPVFLESGATFLRDDFKATNDSMPELIRFLQAARATRKIAVVGRISDHPGRSRRVYTLFASAAAEVVDVLIFVGERPESLWGRHRRRTPDFLAEFKSASADVQLFETVREASAYLRAELRPGDLVLLKGSGVSDHLERILLQHYAEVRCWRAQCGRTIACDACDLLGCAFDPGNEPPCRIQNTRGERPRSLGSMPSSERRT
jgi:UDP-N-acetylmuramoyl-tripeptide--D-alanyl-D-alanine ligase